MDPLKELLAQRDALLAALKDGTRALDADVRAEMEALTTDIAQARVDAEMLNTLRSAGPVAEVRIDVTEATPTAAPVATRVDAPAGIDVRANVEQFIERGSKYDDRFVVRAALTTSGVFADGVAHPSVTDLGIKAPLEGTGNTFLDLIPSRTIDTDTVSYVREVLTTNLAAAVAEGQPKPEATFKMEEVSHGLNVIANWITVTRQLLRSRSGLQGAIENRLTSNVRKKANSLVFNGDGVGANIEGLRNSGIQVFDGGFGTDGAGIHRTIAHAKTLAYLAEAPAPTHYVINPVDAEEYDAYLESTARVVSNGLTRVVSNDQPAGSVTVGALTDPAVAEILYRDGMEVYVSREHDKNLTSNLVTILGEQEAGLAVYLPAAIVEGTFTAAA